MPSEPADSPEPAGLTGPREPAESSGPRRRSFLRGMVGGVAGGVVAGGIAGGAAGVAGGSAAYAASEPGPEAAANEAIVRGLLPPVPFHGPHQAGRDNQGHAS